MATIVAAAGGGGWTTGASWVGGVAPTAADDAQLTASSGNITVSPSSLCRSLDCTGYTGTLTHSAGVTLTIGDGTAGTSNIALKLVAGMTYTLGNTTSSAISFASTSATVQTIDYGGKNTGNVNFNGVGGSYSYSSSHTTGAATTVSLNNGSLNTNGQTCSWGLFSSANTNVRALTLGASAITITGVGTAWNLATSTNMTLTTNTSTITCSGAGMTFSGGSQTYNNVILSGSGGVVNTNASTFANLTRTGTAVKTDSFLLFNNPIITGVLTLASNSDTNRLLIQSNTVGTARTITAATVVVTNTVDFMDITGAGAATWTPGGTGGTLGDCGGNSGITFTTPATQTWSGTSGGNWSANAWTTRVPLPQDDVVINAAFSASQTVTADMPRLGRSIDWTGATGTPAWSINLTSNSVFGSVTLASGMTTSGSGALILAGRSTYNLTSNGVDYARDVSIIAPGGTYTLQDNYSAPVKTLTTTNGGFNGNGFNVSVAIFNSSVGNTRSITLGSGTYTLLNTAVSSPWSINSSGLTFSGASATIIISAASTNTRTFAGDGLTYGTLTYTVAGSTGTLVITGANTFTNINFSDITNARTLQFTAGTTTNVTNWNVNGTVGKLMSVQSVTAATHTLNFANQASSDYLNITNSIATGSAAYAGANSTDGGGNTGWIFTAPPVATGDGSFSRHNPQGVFNLLYGSTGNRYSMQEIANIVSGSPQPTSFSLQERIAKNKGITTRLPSEQELFFLIIGTYLSLPATRNYSTRELLNRAYEGGLTINQVVGL